MEHDRENGPTFLDFPLFLGIFQWDEPTKRVPFTAEPEIPEILTKWKAPLMSWLTVLRLSLQLSLKHQTVSTIWLVFQTLLSQVLTIDRFLWVKICGININTIGIVFVLHHLVDIGFGRERKLQNNDIAHETDCALFVSNRRGFLRRQWALC